MTYPKINNWSVAFFGDEFTAPELRSVCLQGNVTGRKGYADGSFIRTSSITKSEGKFVTTRTFSTYELGEPSAEYKKWCQENKITIDPENPIKITTPTP